LRVRKDNYKIVCACGCGILINPFDKRGRPRKWLNGHFNRKQRKQFPCACGCGTIIDDINEYGKTRMFVHGHNRKGMLPEENSQWKGGRIINDHGYIEIRCIGHRRAHKPGYYVGEHVLVMERHLNACLCDWIIVHHINEIKTDNRIENLMMLTSSQHHILHHKQRRISKALYHLFQ
jgi:hypothetical protein